MPTPDPAPDQSRPRSGRRSSRRLRRQVAVHRRALDDLIVEYMVRQALRRLGLHGDGRLRPTASDAELPAAEAEAAVKPLPPAADT